MCGRYTLYQTNDLATRFRLGSKALLHVDDNYNVAPGQYMPVVIGGPRSNQAELMKWGFIPVWAKDIKIGYKLINARAESVYEKPMWRTAITKYRCLVPARGFYEWKLLADGKTKQPYFIHPKDQELFSFAGLWSSWKDVEGVEIKSFSILTTEANKEMAGVHNRMPVILRPEDEALWLDTSLQSRSDIEPLLRPYEDNGLELYEVSSDVNAARTNDNHLIYPLNSQ